MKKYDKSHSFKALIFMTFIILLFNYVLFRNIIN